MAAVTAVVVAVAPGVAVVAVTPVVVVEAAEAAEAADALEAAPGVEAAVSGGGAEAVVCRGVPAPCASGMNQTLGALASTRNMAAFSGWPRTIETKPSKEGCSQFE